MRRVVVMRRVAVVGCGGSGKSYVARRLGVLLDAPVTHLDEVYYDADWRPLSSDAFAEAQRRVVAGPAWVVDGNYAATLPIRLAACDTVVLVDVATVTALWGVLSRHGRRGARERHRLNVGFLRYVAAYRRRMRPRVLAAVDAAGADGGGPVLVRLRGRRGTRRWLRELSRGAAPRQGRGELRG